MDELDIKKIGHIDTWYDGLIFKSPRYSVLYKTGKGCAMSYIAKDLYDARKMSLLIKICDKLEINPEC